MLRQNIEDFLKKRIWENLGISEMKKLNFFLLPTVCLIFVKIWTPVFTFHFWLINLWWKYWTYVLRIIKLVIEWMYIIIMSHMRFRENLYSILAWIRLLSLVIKCMIVFQVSLNFDPVKKILKIQCHIYILMKKVNIDVTMKSFAPPFSTIEQN